MTTLYAVIMLIWVSCMTAVAGTGFTNPNLLWLSQVYTHCLILITADDPWGRGNCKTSWATVVVSLMPAPIYLVKVSRASTLARGYLHVYT